VAAEVGEQGQQRLSQYQQWWVAEAVVTLAEVRTEVP